MDIGKRYTPNEIETKWYKIWLENGKFEAKGEGNGKFSMVIPPPNITGKIHMGHALNISLQDIITRFNRMQGKDTLWLPGEDHAGIATQHVVEKFLMKSEGKRKEEYGREEFIKRVWEWANEYREHIKKQIMAIGASVDWSRERFTLDDGLNKAVRKVFVELYNEGLIYKGKYIVNWCPSCGTVLSDEEVEHKDEHGAFYHIKYPIKGEDDYIIIATTRPETMLGDTAIAVHPSDERYSNYVGKVAILPLVGREIPIIADKYVDPSFGTGALKVTPAHDPNDYLMGQRHNLDTVQIMDEFARINENGGKYVGLDRKEARKAVIEDLEKEGYLIKIEEMTHSVGHCYRCDTVVEPFLLDQWFVKMKPLAEKAIDAVEKSDVKFYPGRWKKVYLNWMNEIRDWCISRQLWWGHRIPVWYCDDCGHINVSEEDIYECKKCGSKNIKQDEDVLDTWFSSALWPFSTLGWPEKTDDLKKYYPTDLLVTGFDIIFFWVARMIVMGEKFMNDKPFSDVYIHQLVRDKQGRKMSKSLGNGIDPLEIIEKFGADPMRFTLAILAAQGRDIKLDPQAFDSYSKFANKIWNATRFVLLNMDDFKKIELNPDMLELEDKWMLSRLNKTIKIVTESLLGYEFNIAARELYDFFWNEYCDWYIESVKNRLKSENKIIAQNVLVRVLDSSLRLLHPFMPFLTEELWQNIPRITEEEYLITAKWPEYIEEYNFEKEESEFEKIKDFIRGIRNVKAEVNLPQITKIEISFKALENYEWIIDNEDLIKELAFVNKIEKVTEKPAKSATSYVDDNIESYVKLGELIDVESEKERLNKKKEKLEKEFAKYDKKLNNNKFLENAPEDVIEEVKENHLLIKNQLEKLMKLIEELE
ncbi:valine--tRNA ligase [Marinitoga sp. 38H-ov]|uniref:valine--tRNA ligase n=1 Tax=Marinitoga sp. 38H-ov TaxID=1755814 RepID=UPI0013E9B0A8|nr:valine--tRNA ligase [Marinitoga sp. 38H-ov]KAF2955492.1 valine--tRNA ligase [Marinitoga sp. 38H-ov]